MSQPDEFLTRFNEAPDPEPADCLAEMRGWSTERLRAFLKPYAPAARPTETAGGSDLTTETPGPALDLFGRLAR